MVIIKRSFHDPVCSHLRAVSQVQTNTFSFYSGL